MSGRRLYIGRLSQDATRKDVEEYFGTHGAIVDIRIMAGFCFLEYEELKVRSLFLQVPPRVWAKESCPPPSRSPLLPY